MKFPDQFHPYYLVEEFRPQYEHCWTPLRSAYSTPIPRMSQVEWKQHIIKTMKSYYNMLEFSDLEINFSSDEDSNFYLQHAGTTITGYMRYVRGYRDMQGANTYWLSSLESESGDLWIV